MTLSIEERALDDDVGDIPRNDVSEHALQVVNSSYFLAISFTNPREPGEAAEAASPAEACCPGLDSLLQFTR